VLPDADACGVAFRVAMDAHFASHSDWLPCTTSTPPEGLASPPLSAWLTVAPPAFRWMYFVWVCVTPAPMSPRLSAVTDTRLATSPATVSVAVVLP